MIQRTWGFWRLTIVLTGAALTGVATWMIVAGPEAVSGEWRGETFVRVGIMTGLTVLAAMGLARILGRGLADPQQVLARVARQLADVVPSLDIPTGTSLDLEQLAAQIEQAGSIVASRLSRLRSEQDRLEQNQDRLAIVLEAMVEGVIAVDSEQRILLANTAAIRLLELKSDRVASHPLWESVRIPRLQELVRDAIAGAGQLRLEFEVPRTQAIVVAVVSRLSGEPCPGAVIVLHDVTDLRRLENLRREFVSNVSHELKTPLSAISAISETLLDGALDDARVNRGFVSQIEEQASRLNALILDLLELARMESDPQALEVVPIEIGEVIQTSVHEHAGVAKLKNLEVTTVPPAAPVWAWANAAGLRTIADNLINNAINYTPSGGSVRIRWWQDADRVGIEVQDTGVGIAKEHQSRIFERFFRVDRARSREVGGTGLGLAIVKHLCHDFNGEVKVASRLGHGSTFTVRLRAAPAPETAHP